MQELTEGKLMGLKILTSIQKDVEGQPIPVVMEGMLKAMIFLVQMNMPNPSEVEAMRFVQKLVADARPLDLN